MLKRTLFIFVCILMFFSCAGKNKILDYLNTELYSRRFDNADGFIKKHRGRFTEIETKHIKFYIDELSKFYAGFYECQKKYKLGSPETFWETKVCLDSLEYSELVKLRKQYSPIFSNHLKTYEDFYDNFNKDYMAYQTDIGAANLPEFSFGIIKYNIKPIYKGQELASTVKEYLLKSLGEVYDKNKPPIKIDEIYLDFIKQHLFLKIEKLKGNDLNAEEIDKIINEELLSENFLKFEPRVNKHVFHIKNAIFNLYFPTEFLKYLTLVNKFRKTKVAFSEIFTTQISEDQYLNRSYEENKRTVKDLENIHNEFIVLKKESKISIPVTNFEIAINDTIDKISKFYSMQSIVTIKKNLCENYKMKEMYEDMREKEFELIKLGKEVDQNEVKKHTLTISELEEQILKDEKEFFKETNQVFSYRKLCM